MNLHTCLKITLWGSLCCVAAPVLSADVVANFDGGNGTAVVDAYLGKAGGGWSGAWSSAGSNASTVSGSVITTAPLASGSGNYLSATVNGSATNAANTQAYTGRVLDPASFDFAQSISLSFLFRPDSAFSSGSSQFRIMQNSPGMTSATGATNLWTISSGTTATPTWNFTGALTAGGTNQLFDSGISVVTGHVYSFSLLLDMTGKSYVGTVTDLNTSASFTSDVIFFRNQGSVTSTALEFGALLASGGSTTGQSMNFSVDNISVSNIPEPSTVAALMGVGALGITLVTRRRKVTKSA